MNSKCTGSASFTIGNTSVHSIIQGPTESLNPKRSFIDQAFISVYVESPKPVKSKSERALETIVQSHLISIIDSSNHPLTNITVVLLIKNDDGGLLACAINAATVAVLHAGLQFKRVALAACLGTVEDTATLIADPVKAEYLWGNQFDPEINYPVASYVITLARDIKTYAVIISWPEFGIGSTKSVRKDIEELSKETIGAYSACLRDAFSEILSSLRNVYILNNDEGKQISSAELAMSSSDELIMDDDSDSVEFVEQTEKN